MSAVAESRVPKSEIHPEAIVVSRSQLAAARAAEAHSALACCRLCAHRCAVNRLEGQMGLCHAGPIARFFSAQTEVTDELELIPVFAVAFSGCDLRCDFCITGRESWDAKAGEALTRRAGVSPARALNAPPIGEARSANGPAGRPPCEGLAALAERTRRALNSGARSVMILGGEPTIHLPTAIEFAAQLPDHAKLVWKTNAHATEEARRLLDGVFDVWVADYKFGNDACAQRLARVPDYTAVVRENLRWAFTRTDLIVRHLVMPGHVECCWRPIAAWLASELPGVKVNLRTGFWPGWFSARHPELRQPVLCAESEAAFEIARTHALQLVP
jgi:putative pyruvate formate lyase activating enzyme